MRPSSKYLLVFFLIFSALVVVTWQMIVYVDDYSSWGKMRQTPGVRPYEQPLPGLDDSSVPTWGGDVILRETSADRIKSPIDETNQEVLKNGKNNYTLFCMQCHGVDCNGRGTVGQSFVPLPTDLRSEKVQSMSDGSLFKVISYGIPGGKQPPLATTIRIPDRWLIIAYLKSLGMRK